MCFRLQPEHNNHHQEMGVGGTAYFFYKEAQRLSYVARSAFKLLQIQVCAPDLDVYMRCAFITSKGSGCSHGRTQISCRPTTTRLAMLTAVVVFNSVEAETVDYQEIQMTGSRRRATRSLSFGEPRPMEQVLAEKGQDWRKSMKIKETGAGDAFVKIKETSNMVKDLLLTVSMFAPPKSTLGVPGAPAPPGSNFKTKLCENFAKGSCTTHLKWVEVNDPMFSRLSKGINVVFKSKSFRSF
ncbi:Zinc finger CCCH domain-containing protein [Vigna angularis]|uniref:Zinc finger CCCH domain-containing protein n=1 Tax=Phaseolus angularis TaxID=3914 RepID=A0A8T0LD28_PHAAN|nr:Zinc finger CCCH domain-containing protein [Vigna angularis]